MLALTSVAHAAKDAQYTFESATTPLADVAPGGTANDGTASASSPPLVRTTIVVQQGIGALAFTPIDSGTTNQYVTLANESDFDFSGGFTIALWANPSDTAAANRTFIESSATNLL